MRLLLRPFWPMQCFLEARQQSFTCMNIYPFYPSCYIALVLAARLLANLTSHTLRWRGLQKYICLLERTESCWKEDSEGTVYSLGALRECLPSDGANWQHQASHK